MSGDRIFVDTNILIYLLQGDPEISQILDGRQLSISFITELELLSYPDLSKEERNPFVSLYRIAWLLDTILIFVMSL